MTKSMCQTKGSGKTKLAVVNSTKFCLVCDNSCVDMSLRLKTPLGSRSYQCDDCHGQVHYMCAGIFDEDMWDEVAGEEEIFCPKCIA